MPSLPTDSEPRSSGATSDLEAGVHAQLLVLALIWGINFSVIKAALREFHPFAFNALRFPLASATLYALLRSRGPIRALPRSDLLRVAFLGVLGNVLYQPLFILGIGRTSAGNASLLLATTPVWTILLTVLLRHEHPSRLVWLGIGGTVAGMALVVAGGEGFRFERGGMAGDTLMMVAALVWSLYTVGASRLVQRHGALTVTAWTLWIGTVGLVILGFPSVMRTPFSEISALAWAGVAYSGILAVSVAYAIWYRGVEHIGTARTAAYSNLTPVVALLAAWLWLGEMPSPLQLVGAAVILVALSVARAARAPLIVRPSVTSG